MKETIAVYDASGKHRLALSAWKEIAAELIEYRELIRRLVVRDMASQFRQSFLGYLWIALPPVATTIVFSLLRKSGIVNVPMKDGAMPYALFALVGTTLWGVFTQVTLMATSSIAGAGNLVSKIYFPREVLVLSAVGSALINTLVRFCVVVIAFVFLLYAPHWQIVFLPFLLLPLLALGLGLGLIFAPINTMMHDMSRMLQFGFQFGMFLAPTVYPTPPLSEISTTWQQVLYWLHTLNPVSHFIHATHDLIEVGAVQWDAGLVCATVLSFLILAIGIRFFHACEPLLAERM